jgi:hypothetical protein
MSAEATSSSSTELVAGFRLLRRLGRDCWEAVQPELGRRVALRRLPAGTAVDAAAWPERRGVVALYAVAHAGDGTYVATQFVPGARTLAQCRRSRAARRRRWLDEVAAALEGTVHGRLTERDILIGFDGRALVTGFGLAPPGATHADDLAALERMREPRRGRAPALAAAGAAAALTGAAVLLIGDGPAPAPPVPDGATAVGSALAAGDVATAGCGGEAPTRNAPPCTILLTDVRGEPARAPFDGIVRGWAVRGASGRIRLQIVRETPDGYTRYNATPPVVVDDPSAARYVRADASVPEGARFGLELSPGAGAGVRRGVDGAATHHVFGLLRAAPERGDPARGEELMLRVDIARRRG